MTNLHSYRLHTWTSLNHYLLLLLFQALKFVKHPESTNVLSGGDVTLTCEATGTPEPTHYDWYSTY